MAAALLLAGLREGPRPTWLYNGAGESLLAAVLFHALLNLSRIVTYPADGAHYDSAYQAAGSIVAAIAAAVVLTASANRRQAA